MGHAGRRRIDRLFRWVGPHNDSLDGLLRCAVRQHSTVDIANSQAEVHITIGLSNADRRSVVGR